MAIYGFLSLILVIILTGPTATAQTTGQGPPPEDCMAIAYVSFGNRTVHTLVMDNATVFGNYLTIDTDCPGSFSVKINGAWSGSFENHTRLILHGTLTQLELVGDNWSLNHENIIHATEQDFMAYQLVIDGPTPLHYLSISPSDLDWQQTKVAFFTGLIVWFFVQYILWIAINNYVDRYHCQEVS